VVPVIVIVGIAIAGSAWAATGSLRVGLSLLLDPLLAAGLLRLTVAASWEALATAAAVVIVRKLAGRGVTVAARLRRTGRQDRLVGFRLRPSSSSRTPTTTAAVPRTRRRG
jgi:hypothetical protein